MSFLDNGLDDYSWINLETLVEPNNPHECMRREFGNGSGLGESNTKVYCSNLATFKCTKPQQDELYLCARHWENYLSSYRHEYEWIGQPELMPKLYCVYTDLFGPFHADPCTCDVEHIDKIKKLEAGYQVIEDLRNNRGYNFKLLYEDLDRVSQSISKLEKKMINQMRVESMTKANATATKKRKVDDISNTEV
jgi:hypothetical protein